MYTQPNVAVIIPIYNVEKYLEECLDSVINQTYQNLQIVLIDDASTDQSLKIAEEYFHKDLRIALIKNHKNQGLSTSRNQGMNYCLGQFDIKKTEKYVGGGGRNIRASAL